MPWVGKQKHGAHSAKNYAFCGDVDLAIDSRGLPSSYCENLLQYIPRKQECCESRYCQSFADTNDDYRKHIRLLCNVSMQPIVVWWFYAAYRYKKTGMKNKKWIVMVLFYFYDIKFLFVIFNLIANKIYLLNFRSKK